MKNAQNEEINKAGKPTVVTKSKDSSKKII
jgi:hypothetical protein